MKRPNATPLHAAVQAGSHAAEKTVRGRAGRVDNLMPDCFLHVTKSKFLRHLPNYGLFCKSFKTKYGQSIQMKVIHTIEELKRELSIRREAGRKIGLVPTMGALHEGHLSLVRECAGDNDVTVVSIFVNPTQFNDPADLEKYPRTLEADCRLLEDTGAAIVFAPSVSEMYPGPDTRRFHYPPVDKVMEGKFRPGHFNGVCQIVSKLFETIEPHKAYFGEKDYQQLAVIREMVRRMNCPVEVVGCPTVREKDGLAMSSRNTRLCPQERKNAAKIFGILYKSLTFVPNRTVDETVKYVETSIAEVPGLTLEYFSIADGKTLQPVGNWSEASCIIGCVAVFCGEVRLIDNIKYKRN